MADEIKPNTLSPEEVAAKNAEVAAKQAAQDVSGQPTNKPDDLASAESALDKLAAEVSKKNEETEETPALVTPKPDDEAAAKKAEEEAATKKAEEDAAAQKRLEESKKADEIFKDVQLPPGARPKSSEAFAAIKIRATQEIAAREKQLEELKKANEDLQAKLKNPVPKEVEDELANLRQFRAKFDIEADPKFKEYDAANDKAANFIYAKLLGTGKITEEHIKDIKKYGGPLGVNFAPIFETIGDTQTQRLIESQLVDMERNQYEKQEAIKAAQANVGGYIKSREEEQTKAMSAHNEQTQQHLGQLLSGFDWLNEKKAGAGAEEGARKSVEDHNAFVKETRGYLAKSLVDDSAEMRAILIAGMGKLLWLQRTHEGTRAELATAKKQLEDVTARLESIKKAGTTRLRGEKEPTTAKNVDLGKGNDFTKPATQALDDIAREIAEKRQAAGR